MAYSLIQHRPVLVEAGNSVELFVRNNNATTPLDVRGTNRYIKGYWPK